MKCVAPVLDGSGDCQGCIPKALIDIALANKETRGESTLRKFEERLALNELQETNVELIHCPFCNYAEVDDLNLDKPFRWQWRNEGDKKLLGFGAAFLLLAIIGAIYTLLIASVAYFFRAIQIPPALNPLQYSLLRIARKNRGLRFTCRGPQCGRRSCMRCHSLWRDPHSCFSDTLSTLQKSIEAAQSMAIKRVCPRCNLSFVKSSGCNKLVCPCGYQMCYLCRMEIKRDEGGGYGHFCQHFRAGGGRCTECDRCDLYREEDERQVLRAARERAEREWREGEGRGVKVSEDMVKMVVDEGHSGSWWNWAAILKTLDALVERFVVVQLE